MFKGKQYQKEIILLTVRWYLKYSLSYRKVAEMMEERGLTVRLEMNFINNVMLEAM